jgi:hypothetical protein
VLLTQNATYAFIRSFLSNAVTYLQGSKFFYKNGTQFFIKGIAYQKDPYGLGGESEGGKYSDPLADEASCKRDIPIMVEAGTNTIRAYSIDPEKDHDACMHMLQDAGIYVIAASANPPSPSTALARSGLLTFSIATRP